MYCILKGDGCAEKQEFVKQWSHDYHDNPHVSGIFFDHLDLDQDGCLTQTDIDFNFRAMDAHGDHSVTEAEFASFLSAVHPSSTGGSSVVG
uniref:EF-hand domain-containing protein n=1 Tax=Magallana gigas TaxID=29159 RepID=A0A8W8KGS9_MAGGI